MIEMVEQGKVPIKIWEPDGFPTEVSALNQLRNVASLPVVGPHVAVMPDVHWGMGATVGSVIPTNHAIIPAAVGVDIGCGMMAIRTSLSAEDLDGKLRPIRDAIENTIPIGGPGAKGSWSDQGWWRIPTYVEKIWEREFVDDYLEICRKHPLIGGKKLKGYSYEQLGSLGTGNHFIEVCLEEDIGAVWFMLHSGSRGVGNRIGQYFITQARETALYMNRHLPDKDLGWLDEGTPLFEDYRQAVTWAQRFAARNREIMMHRVFLAVQRVLPDFVIREDGPVKMAVNCHHNYVEEYRPGLWLTRKGAVSARHGELGIIPGSMGAKSFIVRGKGNLESFESCSHGAGRRLSRGAANREISLEQHQAALVGVECLNDASTIDESPSAYKDIDAVMAAQADLVDIVATLKQVVCVKG